MLRQRFIHHAASREDPTIVYDQRPPIFPSSGIAFELKRNGVVLVIVDGISVQIGACCIREVEDFSSFVAEELDCRSGPLNIQRISCLFLTLARIDCDRVCTPAPNHQFPRNL